MSAEQFRVVVIILAVAFLVIFYNHDRYSANDTLSVLDKRTGAIYLYKSDNHLMVNHVEGQTSSRIIR